MTLLMVQVARRVFLAAAAAIFLNGCVALPKQEQSMQTLADVLSDKQWQQPPSDTKHEETMIDQQLLSLFDDVALDVIVKQALDNNTDLRIAAERLQQTQLLTKTSKGNRLPRLDGSISADRSSDSQTTTESYSGNLAISWELDVWGRLHQQYQAESMNEQAQIRDYHAARHSIAARTMQLWFEILSQHQLLDIQEQHIQILEKIVATTQRQYRDGLVSIHDLETARGHHQQALATAVAKQQQLTTTHYQLQQILGEYPSAASNPLLTLPQHVAALPVAIPAQTLHQRADLQAAWLRVEAAGATATSNYLSMYPSIELTGSTGKTSSSLSTLLEKPTIWSLLGLIKIPLFQAGQLKNNYQISLSQQQQAYLEFLQKVLIAFHEVDTALSVEAALSEQEHILRMSLQHAQHSVKQAAKDYQSGQMTVNDYYDQEVTVLNRQSDLIAVLNQRLQNRITLGLAIGKGV